MHRVLSLIILLCISYGTAAVAQDVAAEGSIHEGADSIDISSRCALLAARCETDSLRPLYEAHHAALPRHIDLYCRLAFARSTGRLDEVVANIDTLERQCADLFDLRGLLALSDVRCEALRSLGNYTALKRYCRERLDWAYRRGIKASRQRGLLLYKDLAERFYSEPRPSATWRSDRIIVPLSPSWPRLLPVTLCGSDHDVQLPFLYAPDQPMTLISETDAQEVGVTAMGDILKLHTPQSIVQARPARLDSLIIGDLTLRDVMVFIVSDERILPPYDRLLGADLLHHLSYRATSPHCLVASAHPIPPSSGLIISTDKATPVLPQHRVSDYLAAGDLFGLLRNEPSLTFTATDEERGAMEEALNHALTPPDIGSLPEEWRECTMRQPFPGSTPCALMVTPSGLAYEMLDTVTATYRTVPLFSITPTQGHAIDLPNMIIYVP